jgi:hypothetical protein
MRFRILKKELIVDRKRLGIYIIICSFVAAFFIEDFSGTAFLIVAAVIMGNLYLDSKESERKSRQEEHARSLELNGRLIREAREEGKAEGILEGQSKVRVESDQ